MYVLYMWLSIYTHIYKNNYLIYLTNYLIDCLDIKLYKETSHLCKTLYIYRKGGPCEQPQRMSLLIAYLTNNSLC